jgi:hypothetical protein
MATARYVNESTSVIQLDGFNTSPGWSTVVFVSSSKVAGHLVSIQDQTGFISTPRRFIVSSTKDISLGGGISTLVFEQPFSYLSLVAETSTLWSIVNLPPLFGKGSTPVTYAVDAGSVSSFSSATVYETLSSVQSGIEMAIASSCSTESLLTTSSLTVSTPFQSVPFHIGGPAVITSSLLVSGSVSTASTVITQSLFEAGSISTPGSLSIGSALTIGNSLISGDPLAIYSYVTVNDAATISDSFVTPSSCTASTVATSNLTSRRLVASTVQSASSITLGATPLYWTSAEIVTSAACTIPSVATTLLTVDGSLTVSSLTISSFGECSTLSSFIATRLAIRNQGGSATLSSLITDSMKCSTLLSQTASVQPATASTFSFSPESATSVSTLTFADGTTSTIAAQYRIQGGQMFNTSAKDYVTFSNLSVDSIDLVSLTAPDISIDDLYVSTFAVRNSLTYLGDTVDARSAAILNERGTMSTNVTTIQKLNIRSTFAASTIRYTSPFAFYSTTTQIQTGVLSSPSTTLFLPERLNVRRLTIGTTPSYESSLGPTVIQTDIQVQGIDSSGAEISTPRLALNAYPYQYRQGLGVPESPSILHATTNYQQFWTLSNIDPSRRVYFNIRLTTSNTISDISMATPFTTIVNGTSTLFSFNPPVGRSTRTVYDCDITDIALAGPNPITSNSAPYIEISGYGQGYVTADATAWVSYSTITADQSTRQATFDASQGIQLRNGVLRFPSSLNATTIQNSENDISTRNLNYTGSIYTPSDPGVKESIELLPLSPHLSILEDLPLHTFQYTDAYTSTFQLPTYRQLGVLTSELASIAPHAVVECPFFYCGIPTLNLVDKAALRYIHLAATKALQAEVSTVRGMIFEA